MGKSAVITAAPAIKDAPQSWIPGISLASDNDITKEKHETRVSAMESQLEVNL